MFNNESFPSQPLFFLSQLLNILAFQNSLLSSVPRSLLSPNCGSDTSASKLIWTVTDSTRVYLELQNISIRLKRLYSPEKNVCVFNWCPNPRSEHFKTFLFFRSLVREWGLCPGLLSAVLRSKHLQTALPASVSGCFFPFCPCFNASKSDHQGTLLFYHPHPWAHQCFPLPFILSPH